MNVNVKEKYPEDLPEALMLIEELRERIEQLEIELGVIVHTPKVRLSKTLLSMAGILARREVVQKHAMWNLLYGGKSECDWPEPKIMDVNICKLRKILGPLGVEIVTVWGIGWHVKAEHRNRLRDLLSMDQTEPTVPVDGPLPADRKEYFASKRDAVA